MAKKNAKKKATKPRNPDVRAQRKSLFGALYQGNVTVTKTSLWARLAKQMPDSVHVSTRGDRYVLSLTKAAKERSRNTSKPKPNKAGNNPFGLMTASEALDVLGKMSGSKNPAMKLPDGTVFKGKSMQLLLLESKKQNPKNKRNIKLGFWSGGRSQPMTKGTAAQSRKNGKQPNNKSKGSRAGTHAKKNCPSVPASRNISLIERFKAHRRYKHALATAEKVGNASAKKHGRTVWNKQDLAAAQKAALRIIGNAKQRNSYLMVVNSGKGKPSGLKKRNSDGRFETFHGMPSTSVDKLDQPDSAPGVTERLGQRKIKIFYQKDGEPISGRGNDPHHDHEGETEHWIMFSQNVYLESNGKGTHYFICAEKGFLPVFTPSSTFGPATRVEYEAQKPHLENGDKGFKKYFHVLGEEDGKRPILATDHDGFVVFRGGNYHTNKYGINN